MENPFLRALAGVVWTVCGVLMIALPPDEDYEVFEGLPVVGGLIALGGVALVVTALMQRPDAPSRHSGAATSGTTLTAALGIEAVVLIGAAGFVGWGIGRNEIGLVAIGVFLLSLFALYLPTAVAIAKASGRS